MEEKRDGKLKYEKPELVDMMRTGAEGQDDYCDPGSGAVFACYNGVNPGGWCNPGVGDSPPG